MEEDFGTITEVEEEVEEAEEEVEEPTGEAMALG
jgi:hypothetical protein